MKNKFVRFAIAGLALVSAQVASAQGSSDFFSEGSWYLSGSGSMQWHNELKVKGSSNGSKFKTGAGAALAFGYQLDQWRFEVEGSFRNNKVKQDIVDSISLRYWNLMLNVYYDFELMEDLSLYLGAGLGWSHSSIVAKVAGQKGTSSDNNLAAQVMAGLNWRFHEQWSLFAGYRLFTTTKPKYDDVKFKAPYVNILEAGVKFYF